MTGHVVPDRDIRQRDIVPPEKLAACRAMVVGVGAVGRQVALQLSAMGIPHLQLVDPETVEAANLACQGYLQDDLGRPKVEATADLCHQFNHGLAVYTQRSRFRKSATIGNVLFCCVDSIETRHLIWDAVQDRVDFFADSRMAAEVLRVLVACDAAGRRHYPGTLFAADDAYRGSCTAKSTIYCANIAAGFILAQFTRWLRGLPVDADITLNLLASELTATSPRG